LFYLTDTLRQPASGTKFDVTGALGPTPRKTPRSNRSLHRVSSNLSLLNYSISGRLLMGNNSLEFINVNRIECQVRHCFCQFKQVVKSASSIPNIWNHDLFNVM